MRNKIINLILNTGSTKKDRLIGVEIESIVYTNKGKRISVNPSKDYSASDLLYDLIKCKDNNEKFDYSMEPGGQIEWASSPYLSLNDVNIEYCRHIDSFNALLIANDLFSIDCTVEPVYSPSDIKLIDNMKYKLMDNMFTKTGTLGRWMMRNTTSVQVNIDIISKNDGEEMAYLSDCLSPFASLLFANAPIINSELARDENFRYKIWSNTDNLRCGNLFDHGIISNENLIEKFADLILKTPSIFSVNEKHEVSKFNGSINKWLTVLYNNDKLNDEMVNYAIRQIFTHVRFKKGIIELRCADRPPAGYELAPAAFWLGLLTVDSIKETLMKLFLEWTVSDRKLANKNAYSLNVNKIGPNKISMLDWINYFCDLALEGLSHRSNTLSIDDEQNHFIPYLELFRNKGIPGEFRQNEYVRSEKPLVDFIKVPM